MISAGDHHPKVSEAEGITKKVIYSIVSRSEGMKRNKINCVCEAVKSVVIVSCLFL